MSEEHGMLTDDNHVTLCVHATTCTEVSHYFIPPQVLNPSAGFFKKDYQTVFVPLYSS